MPEASKPNIHGCIHGRIAVAVFNPGGVEEINMLPLLLSIYASSFGRRKWQSKAGARLNRKLEMSK